MCSHEHQTPHGSNKTFHIIRCLDCGKELFRHEFRITKKHLVEQTFNNRRSTQVTTLAVCGGKAEEKAGDKDKGEDGDVVAEAIAKSLECLEENKKERVLIEEHEKSLVNHVKMVSAQEYRRWVKNCLVMAMQQSTARLDGQTDSDSKNEHKNDADTASGGT